MSRHQIQSFSALAFGLSLHVMLSWHDLWWVFLDIIEYLWFYDSSIFIKFLPLMLSSLLKSFAHRPGLRMLEDSSHRLNRNSRRRTSNWKTLSAIVKPWALVFSLWHPAVDMCEIWTEVLEGLTWGKVRSCWSESRDQFWTVPRCPKNSVNCFWDIDFCPGWW